MILSELKAYLSQHRRVALTDISNRFDVAPDALRGMLAQWIHKGRVRKITDEGACGTCCGCSETAPEVYEWVERN
jgi:hypothetical protein